MIENILLDITNIVYDMRRIRVIVVGDLMLDEYLWGEIVRISPEAPVPVMHLRRSERALGGAANVAKNIASLGARVSVIGVAGDDRAAESLFQEMKCARIDGEGVLIDSARPTTRKSRLMSIEHTQQVFRLDDEVAEEISSPIEERLLAMLKQRIPGAQAVICSDYLKGVLTQRVLRETAMLVQEHGVPLVTAPKDTRPEKYEGASVLMPNLREFARLAGHHLNGNGTAWIEQAAVRLMDDHGFPAVLVTRGRDGMTLFHSEHGTICRNDIASTTQSVYDVTGAGDTALSVFALAIAAGASRSTAAYLANLGAGIVVGKRGTACVTVEEILERMTRQEEKNHGTAESNTVSHCGFAMPSDKLTLGMDMLQAPPADT